MKAGWDLEPADERQRVVRIRSTDRTKPVTRLASRKTSRAEWLLWLERQDDRISCVLHELTRKRQRYQEEARSLRMALTAEDRGLYDALRSMGTAAVMPSASTVEDSRPRGR